MNPMILETLVANPIKSQLFKQQKEENIQLQQRLSEMEGLRKLEIENQQLQQRIQELEHAVQQHPVQQWGNTMTQQATKVLNKQVKQALEKTIDLRSLAIEPPKENAHECLRLMGMALNNLASAMNNTQALEAAALILGSEPTPTAIANQTQGQVEQGYSATFTAENSVSGVEIKTVDKGESFAPPVPQPEKWSHEAIVARSNMRPERMQKLKVAANSGQNPGFNFLQECWNDDPALQIVIKKLLAKFPQWGVAIVDGVLVDWEG